ncbi:ATP-binding protein [Planomonospora venezuelensis]|uniref:Anti-sigma regulatory factor (Ser/Thr protein kinase) n=1 Tax=Planomonospora venezuelensis TaxID=1999 RepID=A0A841D710_PLAVE|nr:anti-sigma regulatory factor (Ser/Thr protein kinase) [Planomonospora venezuelensis]GIN01356.1 hypothetical protein Pve01_30140 [Planomonospora venezuelensis]
MSLQHGPLAAPHPGTHGRPRCAGHLGHAGRLRSPECVAGHAGHAAEGLLPAVPASVREARSLVRRRLAEWGAESLIDDCVLVVSELVTNAIRHAGAACALRLGGGEGHVHGELFDPGAGAPRMRGAGPEATGGRGLQIVDALTADWGVTWPPSGGKIIWFVLGAAVPHQRVHAAPAAGHARR